MKPTPDPSQEGNQPPTPDPSLEGSRHSSALFQFPSWEGLGVGSWLVWRSMWNRQLAIKFVAADVRRPCYFRFWVLLLD